MVHATVRAPGPRCMRLHCRAAGGPHATKISPTRFATITSQHLAVAARAAPQLCGCGRCAATDRRLLVFATPKGPGQVEAGALAQSHRDATTSPIHRSREPPPGPSRSDWCSAGAFSGHMACGTGCCPTTLVRYATEQMARSPFHADTPSTRNRYSSQRVARSRKRGAPSSDASSAALDEALCLAATSRCMGARITGAHRGRAGNIAAAISPNTSLERTAGADRPTRRFLRHGAVGGHVATLGRALRSGPGFLTCEQG